jgi:hypothetical protein
MPENEVKADILSRSFLNIRFYHLLAPYFGMLDCVQKRWNSIRFLPSVYTRSYLVSAIEVKFHDDGIRQCEGESLSKIDYSTSEVNDWLKHNKTHFPRPRIAKKYSEDSCFGWQNLFIEFPEVKMETSVFTICWHPILESWTVCKNSVNSTFSRASQFHSSTINLSKTSKL